MIFFQTGTKTKRRQQVSYRTQYLALVGIFAIMLTSNFILGHSASMIQAKLSEYKAKSNEAINLLTEFGKVHSEISSLQKSAGLLNKIDSKINVGDVLAEISYLVGNKIAVNRMEFIAEKFENSNVSNNTSAVRPAGTSANMSEEMLIGQVRFKIILSGVAGDSSEVGEFICRLEKSSYFSNVSPKFTRNKEIKIGANGRGSQQKQDDIHISEFEINCYLANYKEN